MRIEFTVYGRVQPGGSKVANKFGGVRDANKKLPEWKGAVGFAAIREHKGELLSDHLRVTMTFFRMRPKGHFRTGRRAGELKESAPHFPGTKPDVLKLARGTEDALTGILWRDDAQTVDLILAKRYGEPERAEIVVETF